MKITDIQALGANLGGGNHIYVKVMTDEPVSYTHLTLPTIYSV